MPSMLKDKNILTPFVVFCILLVIIVAHSLLKSKWAKVALGVFDFLFFFILGLAGILLLFMWFATDHTVTQNNYNLLWALPTNIVAAVFVHSKKKWVKKYFRIVSLISIILLVTWFFLPQQMNNALLPIIALIIFRSWQLSNKILHGRETN